MSSLGDGGEGSPGRRGVGPAERARGQREDGARLVGEGDQVGVDAWVDRAQQREHLVAHAYANEAVIGVVRIVGEDELPPFGVGDELVSAGAHEGTEEVVAPHREDPEAGQRGSSQEPHEHGLGAVVEVMTSREKGGADRGRSRPQGAIASFSRPRLEVAALLDTKLGDRKVHAARPGKVSRELELALCLGSQAVIDAVGEYAQHPRAADVSEGVEEDLRI